LNATGNTIELAAVCPAGTPARSGPTFDIAAQPSVQSAISRQRAVRVDITQEAQHATLAALIGGATGALLVQPLIYQRAALGVLIIGRRHTISDWTANELQVLNGLCNVLAAALATARKTAALMRQVDELTQLNRDRETALSQAQSEARIAKEELQRLSVQLASERARGQPAARGAVVTTLPTKETAAGSTVSQDPFFGQAARRINQIGELHSQLVVQPDDPKILSELTREVGELNELSAPTGYHTLAKLARTLADALGESKQPITSDLLALIGESATALRTLLADAQAMRAPSVDISPLLNRLTHQPIKAKSAQGTQMLTARVRLDRTTPLKTTRAMMVLLQIKRLGQITACQPVEADLRSGGFEDEFTVTFATSNTPEAVHKALASIRDVVSVEISQT